MQTRPLEKFNAISGLELIIMISYYKQAYLRYSKINDKKAETCLQIYKGD